MSDRELANEYADTMQRLRRQWDVDCPGVDGALASFAEQHKATIRSWIGDEASRLVTWQDDEENYSISMLLETNPRHLLRIWPMAWRDDERELKRLALHLGEEQLVVPVETESVLRRLGQMTDRMQLVRAALVPGKADLVRDWKRFFDWTIPTVELPPPPESEA